MKEVSTYSSEQKYVEVGQVLGYICTIKVFEGDDCMDITQSFYDNMASQYDKLFLDWQGTTREHAIILNRIFHDYGFDTTAEILDCACGIGTQAIGLAAFGYHVTASDISESWITVA